MKRAYKSLLFFGTLQFCGNMIEYFQESTQKLVVYYIFPRGDKEKNMVRQYIDGKMIEEKKFYSPKNMLLCYIVLYINYIRILFMFYNSKEKFYVICGHPLFSFGRSWLHILRKFQIVYFIGDYYPGNNMINFFYRHISQYYHDKSKYAIYLTNRLNKKINGKLVMTKNRHTIMWGIDKKIIKRNLLSYNTICFVGVLRESQGIELLLQFLSKTPNVKLKILGSCDLRLFNKYKTLIKRLNISQRVIFPNRSYYGNELISQLQNCSVGFALYDTGSTSGTYYADPAKVKMYAQYNLPIIMTNAAEVADYIKKFNAGVIVETNVKSIQLGYDRIRNNYNYYKKGLAAFNNYFDYKIYYKEKFSFLE